MLGQFQYNFSVYFLFDSFGDLS
ncbi:hypothetical protein PT2222_140309 [Paraburkholderia tropica]